MIINWKFSSLFFLLSSYNQIFLHDEDKKLANMLCYANTDPRMRTFDGTPWIASLAGEFVMYRDRRRLISVSTENILSFVRTAKLS